jgi:hypothetical protein
VPTNAALVVFAIGIALSACGLLTLRYTGRRWRVLPMDPEEQRRLTATAMAISPGDNGLPWRSHRYEMLNLLCTGAVFGTYPENLAFIYSTLNLRMQKPREASHIRETIDKLSLLTTRYQAFADLSQAHLRLDLLRAALGLDGDARTFVDRADLYTNIGYRSVSPSSCSHELHSWKNVREPLKALEHLVLVCASPPSPWRAAICLDYHRVLKILNSEERYLPTETGLLVIRAKYGMAEHGSPDEAAELLAERLTTLIRRHPMLAQAKLVSAVPGTSHIFSSELGRRTAEISGMDFVGLHVKLDPIHSPTAPNFLCTQQITHSESVVLIDDVLRTGGAIDLAINALSKAGAGEIIPICATCSVGPSARSCPADRQAKES